MANIGKMAEMGKLIVAGPFFGNDEMRGIYIFDVQTIEEAKALTETAETDGFRLALRVGAESGGG